MQLLKGQSLGIVSDQTGFILTSINVYMYMILFNSCNNTFWLCLGFRFGDRFGFRVKVWFKDRVRVKLKSMYGRRKKSNNELLLFIIK